VSSAQAFEALCVQLFRLWGRRELVAGARFAAIYGAGGDHGVEAIFEAPAGEVVGLQVKFYENGFDARAPQRLNDSLDAARKRYPNLVRYVIAMKRDHMNKQATPRSKDELTRFDEWVAQAKARHNGLQIDFWGRTELVLPGTQRCLEGSVKVSPVGLGFITLYYKPYTSM